MQATSPPTDGQADPIVQLTKRLREAAVESRRGHLSTRDELAKYAYDKTFDFLYAEPAFNKDLFFKAKCSKAAQFIEIMGAALYPSDPDAVVNSFDWATPTQRERHKIEQQYITYAMRRGDLHAHMRRTVAEALLGGRGVIWTGFNERKGCIQHVFDTVDNFLIDPDAKCTDDANWVARRRIKPRWWVKAMYQDKAEAIDKLEKYSDPKSADKGTQASSDLVEYYEMYFRVGLANYAPGLMGAGSDPQEFDLGDGPMKLCVAEGLLLSAEPWEIPFHLDDMWPCELLDLREKPGALWPTAPMDTGLGHLRALNYMYTAFVNHARNATRTAFMVANYNGQGMSDENAFKVVAGRDFEMVRVTINGDTLRLGDLIQQLKIDPMTDKFDQILQVIGREFEKETGLYEVLYTGTTPTQIRNATTADMIRNSSQSRVEDMRTVMNKFMGRLAYKYAFGARYLHTPDEIGAMFGPQAAQLWGTLAPPEIVQQERAMRAQTKQVIMGSLMQQASMPVPGPMGPMPPAPVDPAQLDSQAEQQLGPEQLVSMDEWMNEASRDIEAGSMRPLNIDRQVENMNVALNQLAPAVATLPGGGEMVAALAVEFARLNRYAPEVQQAALKFQAQCAQVTEAQVAMASMPPPPPGADAGTPEKGPKSGPKGGSNPVTG